MIRRGTLVATRIHPRLTMVTAEAIEAYRQQYLGKRGGYRGRRAALRETVPALTLRDPQTGVILSSAVNTVERFQGDERTATLVSATESD